PTISQCFCTWRFTVKNTLRLFVLVTLVSSFLTSVPFSAAKTAPIQSTVTQDGPGSGSNCLPGQNCVPMTESDAVAAMGIPITQDGPGSGSNCLPGQNCVPMTESDAVAAMG